MGGTDAQFHRFVQGDVSPRKDGPCGVEHFFQIVRHPAPSCTAPGKVGDMLRGESAVVNVAANAHHGSRIEHGVDAAFAVVAHDEPAKLKSAVDQTSLGMIVDLDLAICVLEVAGVEGSTSSDSHPVSSITTSVSTSSVVDNSQNTIMSDRDNQTVTAND